MKRTYLGSIYATKLVFRRREAEYYKLSLRGPADADDVVYLCGMYVLQEDRKLEVI